MLIMNKWKIRWVNCGCASILVIGFLGVIGYALIIVIAASRIEYGWGAGGHYDGLQRYGDRTPQWSADGQTLVVSLGDEIYGASVDGNRLWRIAAYKDPEYDYSGVFKPSLSVNGEVAYLKHYYDEGGLLPDPDPNKYHIELTDINGINATEPNRLFSNTGTSGYPTWSPDGSRLAFATNGWQMTIMTKRELGSWSRLSSILTFWRKDDIRGKYDESVIEDWSTSRPADWSNDGQRLVYVASSVIYNDYTDEYDISVDRIVNVQWDGADEKIAMEQKSRRDEFIPARFEPTSLAWSTADDRIYFVYYELMDGEDAGYAPSVRSVRPDGSDERIIAQWWEGFRMERLKLSPDGSQLLFTTHRSPKDNVRRLSGDELYVMRADGSEAKKVFEPVRGTIYASWSPDGSRIAIHDLGDGGNVFTISPDGTDARVVVGPGAQPGYGKPLQEPLGR